MTNAEAVGVLLRLIAMLGVMAIAGIAITVLGAMARLYFIRREMRRSR